jgi:hypothetical protein
MFLSPKTKLISLSVSMGILALLSFSYSAHADGYFSFDDQTKILTISTQMMDMKIEGGAITYVKDKSSGEVLTDTTPATNFPISNRWGTNTPDPATFLGFTSIASSGSWHFRQPMNRSFAAVNAVFSLDSENEARITYAPLYYSNIAETGSSLVYDIKIDTASGEVIITATGTEPDPANWKPFTIDIPLMNFQKNSVIIGNAKYNRSDPAVTDNGRGGNVIVPSMAIAEGDDSALAVWSQNEKNLSDEYVNVIHDPGYDHLVMHTGTDPRQTDNSKIISSKWHIGTFPNWLEAARRWRQEFQALNPDAHPLWNNRTPWVRDIHAVYYMCSMCSASALSNLASILPPKNLLYYVQGGTHVINGDHAEYSGNCNNDCACNESYGFHVITYFYWDLIMSQTGYQNQLTSLASKGWLPSGYQFNPDYSGADDPGFATKSGDERNADWLAYWSDINANYYSGTTLNVLHPASTKFQDYLIRNYKDELTTRHASGAFFDISGGDHSSMFSAAKKIVNGMDYAEGEVAALKKVTTELPENPIMSEMLGDGIIPYIFYTWDGYGTHVSANKKINHPLRTALIGSFVWTQEQGVSHTVPYNFDDEKNSLLGTLPHLLTKNDYWLVDDTQAIWSQARAKLFSQDELFNDLPPSWDPEALAYYRTKNGTWMKAKKIGESDFGYYEEIPGMGDVLRLQKSNPVVIPRPNVIKSDLNSDSKVDLSDFDIIKSDFLKLTANLVNPKSDINQDGQCTVRDAGIMMHEWGP